MDTSPNSGSANERLISDLATDLVPVRRLQPPGVRALTWLAVVIATAAGLAAFADLSALGHRVELDARYVVIGDWFDIDCNSGRHRGLSAQPARCAPRMGAVASAGGAIVDRRKWRRVLAHVVRARDLRG